MARPVRPKLRPWVIPVVILLVLLLVSFVLVLPVLVRQVKLPSFGVGSGVEDTAQPVVLPEAYREPTTVYGTPKKDEPPPGAPAPASQATLAPGTPPPPPPGLAAFGPPQATPSQIPTAVLQQSPQAPPQTRPQAPPQGPPQAPRSPAPPQAKEGHKWGIDLTHAQRTARQLSPKEQEDAARATEAKKLIKNAIWAVPASPKKTLYRQQSIPGITVDEMISDIPGQYKIRVSVPVFDRFQHEVELIPKDSVVIITQKRVPGYGEKRLELAVEEIQPPTPEVISMKAAVGDKEGAAGVAGDVDNHYGKLILATVISTAISVGGRLAAGNPQGYQYAVGQEVARDAGQQVSQDAKSIVDKQLRVPPTITIPSNTPVSISLLENVTFSRKPITVR